MSQPPKNDRVSVARLRTLLRYDPITGHLYWLYRSDGPKEFNSRFAGKIAGTIKKGYVQIVLVMDNGSKGFVAGHRAAWALYYGTWPSGDIDHRDWDGTNNRIDNLRAASRSENGCNRSQVVGSVRFRGVYFLKSKGKYGAQIKCRKTHYWLGLYQSAEEAAGAYDEAARRLHGDFAVTNHSLGLLTA